MTWGEYLQSVINKPLLLFATATTGVNSDDCLLAVSYAKLTAGNPQTGTLFYGAPASCALHGVDYHKISMHVLNTRGLSMRDFSDSVNQLFRENTPMSYNPGFQELALTEMTECEHVHVVDFPLLFKLAQSKIALKAEELDKVTAINQIEQMAAKHVHSPPPFKRLMHANNIEVDPYTDELPVVTNVQILLRLWELLREMQLVTY